MNVCLGGEYMEMGFPCQENIYCLSGFLDIPQGKWYGPTEMCGFPAEWSNQKIENGVGTA
jgi:hypothetical protein